MKVLIIEDSTDLIETVALTLELRWPEANLISTSHGEKGVELAKKQSPDIIILDLGLPGMNGFEVLRQIRSFSDVPVIILTGRGDEGAKIKGLEMGADDYMVKPFSAGEFLARVKTAIRHSQSPAKRAKVGKKIFIRGSLRIDFTTREVSVADKPIRLARSEYDLLYQLVTNEGKVLSSQMLLDKVWGPDHTADTEHVKVYIEGLRKSLKEPYGNPKMILNVGDTDYKFVSP
jgi:two-component system KDP operon response regulator KdpE